MLGRKSYIGVAAYAYGLIPGTLYINDLQVAGRHPGAGLTYMFEEKSNWVSPNGEIQYLVKEPQCDYEWIKFKGCDFPSNAVSIKTRYELIVGRSSRGRVGYVTAGMRLNFGLVWAEDDREFFDSENYEILICNEKA